MNRSLCQACWMLVALAATCAAQRHSVGDDGQPAIPSTFLPRDIVAAHNAVRARVGTAPLEWSGELAAMARDWAETLLRNGRFEHPQKPAYGQNLFAIIGGVASVAQVVGAWAAESRDYEYRSNRCAGVCGHYTQIVWRDTRQVGCAVARGRGREVWVCDYDPPGNWVGQRPW